MVAVGAGDRAGPRAGQAVAAHGARREPAGGRRARRAAGPERAARGRPGRRRGQRLSEALGASEQRQRDFLLSVSHELRTPLTAVRGYAEALADGVTEPDDVPAVGRTMLAESERLQRLVGDLLDLARLDAVDLRIDAVDVDLAALLDDAEPVWRSRCAESGQVLRVERPASKVAVRTDPARVRQVLDGLAENAVRVTPADAPVVLAVRRGGRLGGAGGARRRTGTDRRRPDRGVRAVGSCTSGTSASGRSAPASGWPSSRPSPGGSAGSPRPRTRRRAVRASACCYRWASSLRRRSRPARQPARGAPGRSSRCPRPGAPR